MSEVQVKLDGESKPVTDVPVQPVLPQTDHLPPSDTPPESPLDDDLPQRVEPIQSTGNTSYYIQYFPLVTFVITQSKISKLRILPIMIF